MYYFQNSQSLYLALYSVSRPSNHCDAGEGLLYCNFEFTRAIDIIIIAIHNSGDLASMLKYQ